MSTGLFSSVCPRCGTALEVLSVGLARCRGCHADFLDRFGCVVPVTVVAEEHAAEKKAAEQKVAGAST